MKRILPVERAFAAFESLTSDERQQFSMMVAGFMRGKGGPPAVPRPDSKKRKTTAQIPPSAMTDKGGAVWEDN